MKISGFTIARNVIKYDYPIVEAITSILTICDEVIVAVGKSEDDTLELIKSINSPKIKIIETVWDETLRKGGKVLANETDKAFAAVSKDSDWAFYIQGDEVIHEKYLPAIKQAMEKFKDDKNVEGLLFNYSHFYGSYDYVGDSRRWYRREIRVIKNDKTISSYLDAQGFRKKGEKLNVKHIDASVYHYGWVKPPEAQQAKQQTFNKLWHDDEWMKKNIPNVDKFDYSQTDSVALFDGTHPKVMQERINKMNWKFTFDPTQKKLSFKVKLLMFIEKHTGWKIGEHKNYKILGLLLFLLMSYLPVSAQPPKEGFPGSKKSSTILVRYEVLNKNSDVKNGHSEKWYRGVKIVSCEYLKGEKNGLWKSQSVDGHIFFQGNYTEDKKNGIWKYYLNQKRLCLICFKDDKKDSTWQSFFQNGNTQCIKTYQDDVLSGPYKLYYENGRIKNEKKFTNDYIEGNNISYHENGVILSNIEYKNGTPYNVIAMNDSLEQTQDFGNLENGTGTLTKYSAKGKKVSKIKYKDGFEDGLSIFYYENGERYSETNYLMGRLDGSSTLYFSNGKIYHSSVYMEGQLMISSTIESADYSLFEKDQKAVRFINESAVQVTAESLGGEEGLMSFIQANFKSPEASKTPSQQGIIHTSFVVNIDGSIQNVKITKGLSLELDTEALEVIKKMPPWVPAFNDGLPVSVRFDLPIRYTLTR